MGPCLVRCTRAAVGALALGLLAVTPHPARACTIDFVPSATAAGRTAIIYDVSPDLVDPSHYAVFIFPGSFGAGWAIRFGERTRLLPLSPRQLHAPWRWTFGDGTMAMGHSVTHTYRTPGLYVLTLSALLPDEPAPYAFDRVVVPVLASGRILATEGPRLLDGSRFSPDSTLVGGLRPLQRETRAGLLDAARQTLAQIEDGAWASIRDYWLHTRGHLPSAYAHVDSLLRQESAALAAQSRSGAVAAADALCAAWATIRP